MGVFFLQFAFIVYSLDDPYGEFKEAPIDFAPTYKFDLNSNGDTYNKHRTPSYTVRIKTENKKENKNIEYKKDIDTKFLFPSIIDLTKWIIKILLVVSYAKYIS
jgi:hypothetical protein